MSGEGMGKHDARRRVVKQPAAKDERGAGGEEGDQPEERQRDPRDA